MQAEFGATPQHVVGAGCPFVVPQIAEFRFVQPRRDGFTEIGQGTGIAEQLLGAGTVSPRIAMRKLARQPAITLLERGEENLEVGIDDIATRQRRAFGPRSTPGRGLQRIAEFVDGFFRQLAKRGDLAAEHRQQRRFVRGRVEFEQVIARDRRRVLGVFVLEQAAYAGVGPADIRRADVLLEIAIDGVAEVRGFFRADGNLRGVAVILEVRRPDQRVLVLVRNREDDALVRVLENVGVVVFKETSGHDVASLDQPDGVTRMRVAVERVLEQVADPRSGSVRDGARPHVEGRAVIVGERGKPKTFAAMSTYQPRARLDHRTVFLRIDRV